MELEALKEKWAEQDRKLETSIRLNRQLLVALQLERVRSPLLRFAVAVGIGSLLWLYALLCLGSFLYEHWAEPRFALPALAMHIWVIASLTAAIRQIVMALRVDYDQPVARIQKDLDSLRVFRIRFTQWALLSGQVVWWIPFLIVGLKGFLGLDAYQLVGPVYLATNVAVGLAFIPIAIWVSKRFAERIDGSPFLQGLMRELGGYNLNLAAGRLAQLSEFEAEALDG